LNEGQAVEFEKQPDERDLRKTCAINVRVGSRPRLAAIDGGKQADGHAASACALKLGDLPDPGGTRTSAAQHHRHWRERELHR
jgi:hypothetical protein